MSGIFFGYAAYYLVRKNFSLAKPYLIAEYGLSKGDVGAIATALSVAYGVSKFVMGNVSDRSNPRYFMAAGLILSGLVNLVFPSAAGTLGTMIALWFANESLNLFSIIGMIMLFGIATKNSILLVDYTNQLIARGMTVTEAIVEAGRTRLRPIVMTSVTLVAGTIPVAIGLTEAAKQRSSMGWVIVGGVISSTLLTLVVVPAVLALFKKDSAKSLPPETGPSS